MINRTNDIREILAAHATTYRILFKALLKNPDATPRGDEALINAMTHCEKTAAAEIELLFDRNGNVNKAIQCPDCGSWTAGEYCQCVTVS